MKFLKDFLRGAIASLIIVGYIWCLVMTCVVFYRKAQLDDLAPAGSVFVQDSFHLQWDIWNSPFKAVYFLPDSGKMIVIKLQ